MSTQHKEIIDALEKIPSLYKDYIKLEKSIDGTAERKQMLSKEAYDLEILDFDERSTKGTGLKNKIIAIGSRLDAAMPDFNLSIADKAKAEKYLSVIGKNAVSDRVVQQLKLFELLEMKKNFTGINDFLNEEKIKELNKFLKGMK